MEKCFGRGGRKMRYARRRPVLNDGKLRFLTELQGTPRNPNLGVEQVMHFDRDAIVPGVPDQSR